VKAAPLAAAALTDVFLSLGPLLPVWIGLTIVNGVILVAMGQWYAAHGPEAAMSLPLEAGYAAASGLLNGGLTAFALRSFTGGSGPRWALSVGVAAFSLVQAVVAVAETALQEAAVIGGRAAGLSAPDGGGVAFLLALVAWVLALALEVRFVLWEVGLLQPPGRRVGLVRSWRDSRGTVLAYLLAYVLVSGALTLIHLIAWSYYVYEGSAAALGVALVTLCGGLMTTTALSAEFYEARTQPGPASVFD
jgi:hypothetical protein